MDITTVRKQPQELLRGGGLFGSVYKNFIPRSFLNHILFPLNLTIPTKWCYMKRVSCYFCSGIVGKWSFVYLKFSSRFILPVSNLCNRKVVSALRIITKQKGLRIRGQAGVKFHYPVYMYFNIKREKNSTLG